MQFPLAEFDAFANRLHIPSKGHGSRPLAPLWSTQRYLLTALAAALEDDIHYVLVLKGRQQGISTVCQAIDLWWPQKYENMQGQVVVESDDTFASFRDVIREMQDSIDPTYRRAMFSDNDKMMVFRRDDGKRGSRLMYQIADTQQKKKGRLGRSRGLNYLHATEVGSWTDTAGVASLESALSETYERRLYLWESTARGYNIWKDMWDAADGATTQRRIFIGWWRHDDYQLAQDSPGFERYGTDEPSTSERQWMRAIADEYEVAITPEQLAWYRYQLIEKFRGDETMLAQEHPCLPEDAFQSFGDHFIPAVTIQRYRHALKTRPTPTALRYEWSSALDRSVVHRVDPATLPKEGGSFALVFEEPDPIGLYVIGARPARSADPDSPWSVLQVCRAYPDRLEQVAEYWSDTDAVFQFAWAIFCFAGSYRMIGHTWLNIELAGTGRAVYMTLLDLQNAGRGLSPSALAKRGEILDLRGSIAHYVFRRPDSFQNRSSTMHWEDSLKYRPWIWNTLRDEMERGTVDIRSAACLDEVARIRRGEHGDNDDIGAGGTADEGRPYALALAERCYLQYAVHDARIAVAPKAPDPNVPHDAGTRLVQNFLAGIHTGPARLTSR